MKGRYYFTGGANADLPGADDIKLTRSHQIGKLARLSTVGGDDWRRIVSWTGRSVSLGLHPVELLCEERVVLLLQGCLDVVEVVHV